MNHTHTFSIPFGDSSLTIETGKLAGQASGAVTVRHGDTMILATAVSARDRKDVDFLPLTVEYKENFYSAGRSRGRAGRPRPRPAGSPHRTHGTCRWASRHRAGRTGCRIDGS